MSGSQPSPPFSGRERGTVILAVATGLALRLYYVIYSLGSSDGIFYYRWAKLAEFFGVYRVYMQQEYPTHPPLALWIFELCDRVASLWGLQFVDPLRITQVAADCLTLAALCSVNRSLQPEEKRPAAPWIFFLSPVAIWISGFHSNSDSLMIALLAAGVALALRDRPSLSGLCVAAATGIKIVPVLVVPLIFTVMAPRPRLKFAVAFASLVTAIFAPPVFVSGRMFLKHVFGYRGDPTGWGLRVVGTMLAKFTGAGAFPWLPKLGTPLMLLALCAIWLMVWRARSDRRIRIDSLPAIVSLTYLAVLFVTPGFGVQYLLWPLPFLPFLVSKRMVLALHAAASLVLFAVYTTWSGGWPWWYADGVRIARGLPVSESNETLITMLGLTAWLTIGCAAVAGGRALYARLRPSFG